MMDLFNPVWDLTLYLGCIQIVLAGWLWRCAGSDGATSGTARLTGFVALSLAVFWLVWGGYSVDAWRYLSRFDRNPLDFLEEQLFWLVGFSLGSVLPDPWPLKVLSALFAVSLVLTYRLHFRSADWRLPLAYLLLLATPGFLLLGGNAIRQGLAGVLGIHAAVWLLAGASWRWGLLAIPAFLIHQVSLVVFLCLLLIRIARRHLLLIWIAAFFVSPVAREVAALAGYNLDHLVAYAANSEGQLHWEKLAVSAGLSLLVLWSTRTVDTGRADFRHVYVALASASHGLLLYEVPFERLLLFADLAIPAALSQLLWLHRRHGALSLRLVALLTLAASAGLWNARSVVLTLGLF